MSSPSVLVVGGGPGGSAAAHWLARDGHDVLVVDRKQFPRDKTCGDGLTPRSIYQLQEMGFDFSAEDFHRIVGLRAYAGELKIEMPWPEHTKYPNWGGVIRRAALDEQVALLAEKQGAVFRHNTEATPVLVDGQPIAVDLTQGGERERLYPDYVVVADGSLSRFGRALGTWRDRSYPFGLAARGYYATPNSQDAYLESHLGMPDHQGRSVAGYGWLFPLGDGTVNIGVGVLSTFKGWKDVNTNVLMELLLENLPEYWGVSAADEVGPSRGGKLPMSMSVGPKVGRNWLLVGDAAGAVNAFTGEGIEYAYETGRIAARHISEAIASGDPSRLASYSQELEDTYASYNLVARRFMRLIGRPSTMRRLTRAGLRVRPAMEAVLKVMANLLDPDDPGFAERSFAFIERVAEVSPRA
ncbi:MAG: geranylgeranyl reductase family protein [Acidimicrobiia bacterium]|nr:geranylgeranyl reductase family protein [Acidimicrobiia bacterium]